MKSNVGSLGFSDIFPFSTEKGGKCSGLNHQKMRLLAKHGVQLEKENINSINCKASPLFSFWRC